MGLFGGNDYQQQQGGQYGNPYQQYANAYDQGGNFEQFPHQDVYNHYQQAYQQAPDQMYQAQHQYYQQMPQQQRQGLFGGLINAFTNNGIQPQQAGIMGNEPSPQNLANGTRYAAQNPDIMSSIFGQGGALSSPLAKAALAGGLAIAAKQFLGGGGGGGILGGLGGGGKTL